MIGEIVSICGFVIFILSFTMKTDSERDLTRLVRAAGTSIIMFGSGVFLVTLGV